jgi:CRP-like cAMP-binding protein
VKRPPDFHAVARAAPLLDGVAEEALRQLDSMARCHDYPKHNVLFHRGDPGGAAFLVVSGEVKLCLANEEAREIVVGAAAAGTFLGLLPLLDGGTQPTSAITVARSRLARFDGRALLTWMERHVVAPRKLLREVGRYAREAYQRLGDHALMSVKERLLAALLEIAEREGRHGSGRDVVFTRPTHQELADRIGSSREVVSRILKGLLESDLLTAEGRVIRVSESALVLKDEK